MYSYLLGKTHRAFIAVFPPTTVSERKFEGFTDNEDEEEFGSSRSLMYLYAKYIWRLKHNDESLGMLTLRGQEYVDRYGSMLAGYNTLSEGVCRRLGKHMCGSKYIRSITIQGCDINEQKMKHLFGPNAPQFEANDFVKKSDILQRIGLVEQLMRDSVMEYVNVFPRLEKVVLSDNPIGVGGLQVLVQALGGTPIGILDVSRCGLSSVVGVAGLRHCKELTHLNISGNCVRNDVEEIGSILDCDKGCPLYELNMGCCQIDDSFVDSLCPILEQNKSLRFLFMQGLGSQYNYANEDANASLRNQISESAVKRLEKLYIDTTNFKSILKKPSSINKICVDGNNLLGKYRYAGDTVMDKYIKHFNETSNAVDMSPFMECEVGLIPHIIASILNADMYTSRHWLSLSLQDTSKQKLTALYIVYSTKMFRNRIEATSNMVELQSANENLQNEVERLRKELAASKLGPSESIANRVKARKRRK